jgi:ATP-dependent DNA helicase RecQ
MEFDEFVSSCVVLDLEVGKDGRIRELGAIRGDQVLAVKDIRSSAAVVQRLDDFARGATWLVGHNIVAHDRTVLGAHLPGAGLLRLPVVDTLYLAPLAYPTVPYHALVKDYKLVAASKSDPVADCRLALQLFRDCWSTLAAREKEVAGIVSLFRFCFDDADAAGGTSIVRGRGVAQALEAMGAQPLRRDRVERGLAHFLEGRGCLARLAEITAPLLDDPTRRPALAYALAWLRVAGKDSVLPRWVHHTFPDAPEMVRRVRGAPCGSSSCTYCVKAHNVEGKLNEYFGFQSFRPKPATTDGASLQSRIVERSLEGRSLLAILPTGAGKSLCFQLPAIMRNERSGALTVVISPLQALMVDQVQNLDRKTQTKGLATALTGLLTPPERHATLEGVRMGRFALLYVSPEQLRSSSLEDALRQREIACWVFDEAHCLSKWGHDFRTDYTYAGRFIREFSERERIAPAPVACFTATAKLDVREEIRRYFRDELRQELDELASDRVYRDNLHYGVEEVRSHGKAARIDEVLRDRLGAPDAEGCVEPDRGVAIVYAARRRATEELAAALKSRGWAVEHFHAGLEATEKKRVQGAFIEGKLPLIVATNAFGMGIDKDDVRLVVHADIPGSVENYLQEAGRAGRDGAPAWCVLLFDSRDLETQFDLSARSRISRRDIAQILGAIKRARRKGADEVVVSPGELLRVPGTQVSFDAEDSDASTKVKTAIAWLERARFVLRDQNRTHVFQGVPAVRDAEEARVRLDRLNLAPATRAQWEAVLQLLLGADDRDGIATDDIAALPVFENKADGVAESAPSRPPVHGHQVLRTLHEMAVAGLIDQGLYLTAYVWHKTKNRSLDRLERVTRVERTLLDVLQEAHPDPDPGQESPLSLRMVHEQMRVREAEATDDCLTKMLAQFARDGVRGRGSLAVRGAGRAGFRVAVLVPWAEVRERVDLRNRIAGIVLECLLGAADLSGATGEVLVRFSLEEVRDRLAARGGLTSRLGDPFDAIEAALLYLHEQDVIVLQKGLAIFRQAMTLRLLENEPRRRYVQADYQPLDDHYAERVFQIHAMGRYAELARTNLNGGARFVEDYFRLRRSEFARVHFGADTKATRRATSAESYAQIVESLRNEQQEAIVTAPTDRNFLVLAGPGSGKTRVVVHRCAYLLRVSRVPPERLLVVCFNRSAMHELRVRLRDLVGDLAKSVAVHTYHGLALRLTERSLAARTRGAGPADIDFDAILEEANCRLRGEVEIVGVEPDHLRDRLLAGFEHVLVDEYQDINAAEYELVCHIAKRKGGDEDRQATILAVGDDDQSIYGFLGANVEFLRRFETEFEAERRYLEENFRSTRHIVDAANALVAHNADRMKTGHPIRVDRRRAMEEPGGPWTARDPISAGHVQAMQVRGLDEEIAAAVAEIERLRTLDPTPDWGAFGVIASRHSELEAMRAALEAHEIPCRVALASDEMPRLHRVREIRHLLRWLTDRGVDPVVVPRLRSELAQICGQESSWAAIADQMLATLETDVGTDEVPASDVVETIYEGLSDHQRAHSVGHGVFLTTAHSAKGLEFRHVLVLGGDWRSRPAGSGGSPSVAAIEERRRTYYVGLTRARETLTVFERDDDRCPFVPEIDGAWCRRRNVTMARGASDSHRDVHYGVVGMKSLFLDYAGRQPPGSLVHKALAALRTGEPVRLVPRGKKLAIVGPNDVAVALLSMAAEVEWGALLGQINDARVMALVERTREMTSPEYQSALALDVWEVPIVELRYRLGEVVAR